MKQGPHEIRSVEMEQTADQIIWEVASNTPDQIQQVAGQVKQTAHQIRSVQMKQTAHGIRSVQMKQTTDQIRREQASRGAGDVGDHLPGDHLLRRRTRQTGACGFGTLWAWAPPGYRSHFGSRYTSGRCALRSPFGLSGEVSSPAAVHTYYIRACMQFKYVRKLHAP